MEANLSVHTSTLDREPEKNILETDSANKSGASKSVSPCPSQHDPDDQIIVSFEDNDPTNPYNWSQKKKTCEL